MDDPAGFPMPWGKHKGRLIGALPSSYLRWVAETWEEDTPLKKRVVVACDREWTFREDTGSHFEDTD